MKVKELMHQPVFSCSEEDSMSTAAGLMWDHDCGAVPVTDGDGRLIGMITDRDICMSAFTKGQLLSALPVRDGMAREIFSCHGDDSLEDIEQTMGEHQIRRMPVVDDDNRPVGVVSLGDLALYSASQKRAKGMQRDVLSTLADISKPRARA